MWRNETQLKLNDLLLACQASVEAYEQAAQLVESPTLAEWLRAVARYRERLQPQFEEQVRALNDLPRMPDPEVQLLEQILTRFRASLPTGGGQQILDERYQADQEMLALAKSTRDEAVLEAVLGGLDELITHLEMTLEVLAEA